MKFRVRLDSSEADEGVRTIKDLVQRDWHFASVGMGNCKAAQANRHKLNEQLLIQSAALANANFDSDEPRDRYGKWTTNATDTATSSPIPAQLVGPSETAQSTLTAAQVHTSDDALKFFAEHATRNPVLRQLLLRTLRVLTSLGSPGGKELSGLSKAIVADVAAEMMRAPEFGGNIRAFILGKAMPVDQALRDSALEQQFRGEAPTATVAGNLSVKLAEVLPMILGMRVLPVGVQKIFATIFTIRMLKDAPGIARQLISELRKPTGQRDYNKIDSLVADAISTLGFTVLGTLGSKESSKADPVEGPPDAGESRYSEPGTLPKPDETPDTGAVYVRPKDASEAARARARANKAAGDAWENEVNEQKLPPTQNKIQKQITVKSSGPSGKRVRLDAVGTDKITAQVQLTDAKASATAPLTRNQTIAYPELETHGGVVVGKGKPPYNAGTKIPPTKVNIIRKP